MIAEVAWKLGPDDLDLKLNSLTCWLLTLYKLLYFWGLQFIHMFGIYSEAYLTELCKDYVFKNL